MKKASGQPIAVVAAVIERTGRFLIAQRPPNKQQGLLWEFPGGKIEAGETAEEALKREIHEELGLQIEVGAALPEHVHDYGTIQIRLLPFRCRILDEHAEGHAKEHVAIRWVDHSTIRTIPLAPADWPIVEALGNDRTQ